MQASNRRLDHRITVIDAGYIHPGVASFYLLIAVSEAAFIDTGTTRSLPRALAALQEQGLTAMDVRYVIPTHVHLDHAGGAGAMMRAFPRATLIVHPLGARHMIDPSRLVAGTNAVYGEEQARELYGEIVPVPRQRVVTVSDNETVDFNGQMLRFIDTPGHARHHFCVLDETSRGVFTGDTLGISYRVFDNNESEPFLFPTTPPTQFEPEVLHRSIDRIMHLTPRTLYLAHFGPIHPDEALIGSLHEQLHHYVAFAQGLPIDNRLEEELEPKFADYLCARALRHGTTLPESDIRRFLAMDARLNAQGVALWWRRSHKTAQ